MGEVTERLSRGNGRSVPGEPMGSDAARQGQGQGQVARWLALLGMVEQSGKGVAEHAGLAQVQQAFALFLPHPDVEADTDEWAVG